MTQGYSRLVAGGCVCVRRADRTCVDGLATGRGFGLPSGSCGRGLADFRLVSDAQIGTAQRLLASHARALAEGAGAAAQAADLARPADFAGWAHRCSGRVNLNWLAWPEVVCTGGNASSAEIAALGAGTAQTRG